MQVTGSKTHIPNSTRLSIRIPSGQSLHWEDVEQSAEAAGDIEIVVEGPVVVAFPRERAEGLSREALLQESGIAMGEGWCAATIEGAGAVWYAARLAVESATTIERLRSKGHDVKLTTPLEKLVVAAVAASRHAKNIFLRQIDDALYVAFAESHRLRYAEVLPLGGESDLVNLLALLNKDFDLRKGDFTLVGEVCGKYYKTVRKYFRRVKCEK